MTKNLVIVESPAKAKTIEKFLGDDYTVRSCYGHIRDLAPDGISVDVERDYEPSYQIPSDKKSLVNELKKLAKDAEQVWLATDEDREGEAISWHLQQALNLNQERTHRIVFHEITKPAVEQALQKPRNIDKNLVDAQQARRILDRLVGFELSPILWRKVRPSLSAGRVQSVAVRLIVERERNIRNFTPENFFRVRADFQPLNDKGQPTGHTLKAELPKRFDNQSEAQEFLEACKASAFQIDSIEQKPTSRKPAAPFTTSTLQQEASRKLSFSVSKTMTLAQRLYEAGHITYMRTDSVNLSEQALNQAQEVISQNYGNNYSQTRRFQTKSESAQEAHEAIRPTNLAVKSLSVSEDERKLYDLIWKRTIASQMANAKLEKTTVKIGISRSSIHSKDNYSQSSQQFTATGEVVKFDGFLRVYIESTDEEREDKEDESLLPPLQEGQPLKMDHVTATERFTRPSARFTEASLVKKLEELGIGRPSTYAPTISTIQKRGYIEKSDSEGRERQFQVLILSGDEIQTVTKTETTGADKGKLMPTNTGMVVNDFLLANFENIMDFNFTARVEEQFDEIAKGDQEWRKMIDGFYSQFHPIVEDTEKNAGKFKGERLLGQDPESGRNVYAKIGKYGAFAQIGEREDEDKPRFAKLRDGQLIENITLEEALDLFKLPRELGNYEEKPVQASIGRFGPYVKHGDQFFSLPKTDDPYTISYDRAIEVIEEKREAERQRTIIAFEHEGATLKALRGRFGAYINYNKANYKIPKSYEAESLTQEDCIAIVSDPENLSKKKGSKKQSSAGSGKAASGSKNTGKGSGSSAGSNGKAAASKSSKSTAKKTTKSTASKNGQKQTTKRKSSTGTKNQSKKE